MRGLKSGIAAGACLLAGAAALSQAPSQPKPLLAEEAFKNVQVLKGIPADEFMSTMGIFSAALGMSCEDCHASNDSKWENYALDTSPRKTMARRMVGMMAAINRGYFGGRQVVTCYSCHRGANTPRVTPNLATLYSAPPEPEDLVEPVPNAPSADSVLDKYVAAIGGAQRVAALTSFSAKGTSSGYGPESDKRPVEIFSQAPDQRVTIIHTLNGDNTTAFDGRSGWVAAPLRPIPVMAVTGQALEGLKLEAELAFPARIKQMLGKWRVGVPATINDRDLVTVQGTSAGGAVATLYFDPDSGLLVRFVRFADSAVGRVPTLIDYSDYREVAGVKMPFRWTMSWLDGKENFELSEVQPNVAVDPARFAKPSAPAAPAPR
jgi:photosynthetic reaction center cytochrome c subunit